jgi:multisubunit Na+/H+ antiporter MnhB subunit
MATADLLLDGVLSVALVGVAWSALHSVALFRGVVLYIVYGLLIALCWARLGAPDIALAEAAVGAGLTGALLLDAARQFGDTAPQRPIAPLLRGVAAVVATGLTLVLVAAVLTLPREPGGLTELAVAELDRSGVGHPVTAVLLNYRAYDTWLEVGVLLLAGLAVLALRRGWAMEGARAPAVTEAVLGWSLRWLLPLATLVAVYLLARGAYAPGGAFQAGAVGGAALVLFVLAGHRSVMGLRGGPLRLLLGVGLSAFCLAAAVTAALGRMLELPPAAAYGVILVVEAAVAVSIAVTLAALFVGARPTALPRAGRGGGEESGGGTR